MHDRLAMTLQDDLTEQIVDDARARRADRHLGARVVDSFIGRMLGNIAAMARVLDAQTVVVGMRPAVAITLVELGLSLPGVRTALDVEKGMALIQARARRGSAMAVLRHEHARRSAPTRTSSRSASVVREWAIAAGFSLVDQTKIVTAASELARNTLEYGGGGTVRLEALNDGARRGAAPGLRGPGPGHRRHRAGAEGRLHDRRRARARARRRAAARRTSSTIESTPGEGTRVTITRWK